MSEYLNNKVIFFASVVCCSLVISATGCFLLLQSYDDYFSELLEKQVSNDVSSAPYYQRASYNTLLNNEMGNACLDFTEAVKVATPTVVHITTSTQTNASFGTWESVDVGTFSGSGVIVSSDGYIVTNNHVIANSKEISVSLYNKKKYKASIIGVDASTDLALIKITPKGGEKLPAAIYGDADMTEVGEWVLAVGNPFNLTSTVTAGIISAKSRNINILQSNFAIEAFIQTDAAVNQGNSGGALVNMKGQLIGINTAIATPSGTYAGYSFAVPVNIVRKIVEDIKETGSVQHARLGMATQNINEELAKKLGLKSMNGVHVEYVYKTGTGPEAGLRKNDVIIELNGYEVKSVTELKEKVARFSPGDVVSITYIRDGKEHFGELKFKNDSEVSPTATTEITTATKVEELLGLQLNEMKRTELLSSGLLRGIRVEGIVADGIIAKNTEMRIGFIITKVNSAHVKDLDDFYRLVKSTPTNRTVMLGGVYLDSSNGSNAQIRYYAFDLENK